MNWVEIVGVTFGLVCVYLTVRQNIWCWPTGILNNIFFVVLFTQSKLYADVGLQILYIGLGIYGWIHWLHGGPLQSTLRVSRTPKWAAFILLVLGLTATLAIGRFFDLNSDTDVPYPDAFVTSLCLVAQWMMTKKWLENWPVWIVSNLCYIGLYSYKELYLTAAVQVVFIALSVVGYLQWKREWEINSGLLSENSVRPIAGTNS